MKINTLLILCIVGLLFIPSAFVLAQSYVPMAGNLPIFTYEDGGISLQTFIPDIYRLAVGVGSVIAVVMIVLAGFQYMTSEAGKSAAKESIRNALIGLLMLLGSYLLLSTINPRLLDINIDVSKVPTDFVDFIALAKENGSYSGYTERMISDMRQAREKYNEQLAAGDIDGANETYYNQVTKTNYELAMQYTGDDIDSVRFGTGAINHMNTFYETSISSAYEEGNFERAKQLEAEQRLRVQNFQHASKANLIEKSITAVKNNEPGSAALKDTISAEYIKMQSESRQTYQYLLERDPRAAEIYRLESVRRLDYLSTSMNTL